MDHSEIENTLAHFEPVWQRVKAPPPGGAPMPPPPPPPRPDKLVSALRGAYRAQASLSHIYAALSRRTGGDTTLRRLWRESQESVEKLGSELFLRTGDSEPLPRPKALPQGVLPLLRMANAEEERLEACYEDLAQKPGRLRRLAQPLAERCQEHQDALRRGIGSILR